MTKKNLFCQAFTRRLFISLLGIVMAVLMIPGLSAPVSAAEVKGSRLLIQVQGEDGYRVPELSIYYLPPDSPTGEEPKFLGHTDARGELVFTELEEGEFQFFYSVPNIKSKVRVPYSIKDINGRPTLTISDPRLIGEKDAELTEESSLQLDIVGFQVVDAQGNTLPNTKLSFRKCPSVDCDDSSADGHKEVFTTITDREGNCARTDMLTGSYHIKATVYDNYHREQFSEETFITIAPEDEKQSRTIPLSGSKPVETSQPTSGVLTLCFENENGQPQADIRVGYREPGDDTDYWLGCADSQGKISISNLKKGEYTFFYYLDPCNNHNSNRTDFEYEVEDTISSDAVTVILPISEDDDGIYKTPLQKWVLASEKEIETDAD